ncbi:MAG: type II secretion system protein [Candidatus Zapsychrus exili]|nr:type II secretion system protein [Candidatus Zapsychrus exili]
MNNKIFKKNAMTFIEVLIVISLFSVLSIALYNALANGLRVWDRSNYALIEEDIVIFFDKINSDLRNTFYYSKISFEGTDNKFSFPTIVYTPADPRSTQKKEGYVNQIGKVEYYFDSLDGGIYKREANYSKAESDKFFKARLLVGPVDSLGFKYFYSTDSGEIESDKTLETFPSGLEVTVEFTDKRGKRKANKFINIIVGY